MAEPTPKAAPVAAGKGRGKVTPVQSARSVLGQSFWEGFSVPSTLAFKTFLLSLAATCAFCMWFFTESTLAGYLGEYLPRSGRDAEGFATHEALRAGHEIALQPRLLLLGTSTIAQAVGSGTHLQARLLAATGQNWDIVNLTTPLQAPTDQFALLDRALEGQTADGPPVIVVLGFGVQRLRWTAAKTLEVAAIPRLGLRSDWADEEITHLGGTTSPISGFYLHDNFPFVLINGSEALIRLATFSPARRKIDSYAEGKSTEPKPEVRKALGDDMRAGIVDAAALFAQIDRLAVLLGTRSGVRLVLIEDPLSPELIADQNLADIQTAFAQQAASFATSRKIAYWPIGRESNFSGADFFDDLHVRQGAPQERFQNALAEHLAGLIVSGGNGNGG